MVVEMTKAQWLPYLVERRGDHDVVRLIDVNRLDLSHAFLHHALEEATTQHLAQAIRLTTLPKWLNEQPEPDHNYSDFAAIFHVSRCGSTLLSHNISVTPNVITLREPPFFRTLRHRLDGTCSLDEALAICLKVLACWRRWAASQGKRLVIKFNSQMHTYAHQLFSEMAGARFVFLHRDPVAVLESLDRNPPSFLRSEAAQARFSVPPYLQHVEAEPIAKAAAARFCATVDCFSRVEREDLLTVAYPQLASRFSDILRHLRLDPDAVTKWSATRYAKARKENGDQLYVPVSAERMNRFTRQNAHLVAVASGQYDKYLSAEKARSLRATQSTAADFLG